MSEVEAKDTEATEVDPLPAATATIEDAGAARKRIKIEIPAERIAGKLKEAQNEIQRDAVLPGFRKGRAPKRLIEKRFGGDMKNTVKQQVIAEAYQKAIEDNKIDAIGEPDLDITKIELPETGPLTLSVEVEVTPDFEIPNIENVKVKKPKLEANDERLGLAVENLRKYFGQWKDTGLPVTADDVVLSDLKVTGEDGAVIAEQASVQLKPAAGAIAGVRFEDLGEKLVGKSISEVVTLEATAPADHADEKLRGKKLTAAITIKGVKHQDLPEVNEQFATMLGFDSLDQLKSDLKDRLVVQLVQETKSAMAQQVYRYLLENTRFEIPAKLSQRQMGNVLRRRATEMMSKGVPESEIVQHIDELRISSAQQAAVDLRLFFILSKIGEGFGVEVSNEEVNARIAQMAEQYGRRPEKIRSELSKNGQIEQLYLQVRDGKVVDKILETAEITEVDEKELAEEFKNLPPLANIGPNVTGVSHSHAT